jgi:hypothetical protein
MTFLPVDTSLIPWSRKYLKKPMEEIQFFLWNTNIHFCIRFEVLTALSTKNALFLSVLLCRLAEVDQCFRGTEVRDASLLLFLVACLAYSSVLQVEAICTSKTSVNYYQTAQHHITFITVFTGVHHWILY